MSYNNGMEKDFYSSDRRGDMLYTALIVDDDRRILDGLSKNIDWMMQDFEAPLVATGGREALQIMKDNKVHLLITDIKMPVMSGLELAEKVSVLYPDTVIVILSCYDDFQYAKKAMRFGVKYYLTKPTDISEFINMISTIKNALKTKTSQKENIRLLERKFSYAKDILIEQFFADLIIGSIRSLSEITEMMIEYNIHFRNSRFCLYQVSFHESDAVYFRKSKHHYEENKNSIEEIIDKLFKNTDMQYYKVVIHTDTINIILNHPPEMDVSVPAHNLISKIKADTSFKPLISVSMSVDNIDDLHICYRQVRELHGYFGSSTQKEVIHYSDIPEKPAGDTEYPKELESRLLKEITSADKDNAFLIVDDIFNASFNQNLSLYHYQEYFLRLFYAIDEYISDFGLSISSIVRENIYPIKKALSFDRYEDMVNWIKSTIAGIIDHTETAQNNPAAKISEKIKEYIECNYNKDITLISVSEHFHLSPAYISRLFKKCTGYNFIGYLSKVRIDTAKALLADARYKVYEISELAGYGNTKHFSQVFKNLTGQTPTEYRQKIDIKW